MIVAALGVAAGPALAQTTTRPPAATALGTTTTTAGTRTTGQPAATTTQPAAPTTTAVPTTTTTKATTTDPASTTTDPTTTVTDPTTTVTDPTTTVTDPTTTVDPTTTSTTTIDPTTTSTTLPVDALPAPAATAPPVGADVPPELTGVPVDPVASAAQLTYAAFSPWRQVVSQRAHAQATLAALHTRPDATPDEIAVATAALTDAGAKVASLSPGYRFARDALADAVVGRAGHPPSDAVELSATWERTDSKRLGVVFSALMQVGDPYVFAAVGPGRFDCSGLTLYSWRTAGVDLVHYAITQREQSLDATPETLLAGDLVFRFSRPGGHVMMYLGVKDLVVQAGGTATGVAVSPWGRADAFGSPLAPAAAATPDPAAPAPAMFGAEAGQRRVSADIPFADAFNVAGARYGVSPSLLAAIASVGTGYRADAASAATTNGLMQLRPAIAAELRVDPAVPFQAVDGAARRLVDLWNRLHHERAVVATYRSALRVVNEGALVPHDPASDAFFAAVTATTELVTVSAG